VACNDDECVPFVCSRGDSFVPVTRESRATYAAAMEELCESFSPEEEVNIFIVIVLTCQMSGCPV